MHSQQHAPVSDAPVSDASVSDASVSDASERLLGATLAHERGRALIQQRVLAAWSGVLQQSVSAYERGTRTPSWSTFVRLLAAMDRRPVLRTAPLETSQELIGTAETRLETALGYAIEAIGGRPYRIESEIAAYLHGDESVYLDELTVWVRGGDGGLDELAADVARVHEVHTIRGPRAMPHLSFEVWGVTLFVVVTDEELPAVEVAVSGMSLKVAPAGDIRYRRPA